MKNEAILKLISDDYFSVGNYVYITIQEYAYPNKWPITFKINSITNVFDSFLLSANFLLINKIQTVRLNCANIPSIKNNAIFLEIIYFLIGICFYRSEKKSDIILDNVPHASKQFLKIEMAWEKLSETELIITNKNLISFFSQKHENINKLYEKSYLVPWNLVPREWDVLDILFSQNLNHKRVLDLGSGTGKNTFALADRKIDFWAIEQSPIAVKIAQKCYPTVKKRFLIAQATSLPFDNAYFDYILDIGCIHCMKQSDYDLAIKEIARVLKPGGYLFSRIFLKKGSEWLKRYPVQVDSFGFLPDNVRLLLEKQFNLQISIKGPFIYIQGERK